LINIEEKEKIKSGIDNWEVAVDGESVLPESEQILETAKLADARKVTSEVELGVRMAIGSHSVQVIATDHAGNAATMEFAVEIVPQDVISVVLPTTFEIAMRPGEEENKVRSDDIVICNRSDFPLDVQISGVEVTVDKTIPEGQVLQGRLLTDDNTVYDLGAVAKSCDLDMEVLTAGRAVQTFATPEGISENITSFRLEEGQEGTDPEALRQIETAESVNSPDYAIVRFRGQTGGSENLWKDGDLTVKVIFSFAKHVESEQVSEEDNLE
jgi:hypothetical protein